MMMTRCDVWARRAEQQEWASAVTLADVGELTARWAEGTMLSHPSSSGEQPAEETEPIRPVLALLNRGGFVTYQSQPGLGPVESLDGRPVWQRAAVDGLMSSPVADRVESVCSRHGLVVIRNGPARRWRTTQRNSMVATASPVEGDVITEDTWLYPHSCFGAHLSRREMMLIFGGYAGDAVCVADQVTVIDPVWGRVPLLWSVLLVAVSGRYNT